MLQALDEVGDHHAEQTEEEQGGRVLFPALGGRLPEPAAAQEPALAATQAAPEGRGFALEDAMEIDAERLGQSRNHQEKEDNLEPTV